eukprot:TRINITY_DN6727_c0_g1_i1.p1 TRINITY_DN6727_c0_g1~~TRINITY_DN6727_c0_g1_i1.p1  ORF type:complete len:344 (+),score=97.73 TRINITY_DN6727_c0_g1_i1:69-1100(+)
MKNAERSWQHRLISRFRRHLPLLLLLSFLVGMPLYYWLKRARDPVELQVEALLFREDSNIISGLEKSEIMNKFQVEKPVVFGTLSDGGLGLMRTLVMIWGARSVGNVIPWAIFVPKKENESIKITENAKKVAEFLGAKIHFMDWIDLPPNFHPGEENWSFAWQKMSIWKFDQYEKIVLVDSDTIFQKSGNEMVDFKDFTYSTGTCSSPCVEYFWEMNAGVITFKPSKAMFDEFMEYARNTKSPTDYRYVEQDLLWLYYFKNKVRPSYHMSNLYNMCILWCNSKCFPDNTFEDLVIIAHFVCMGKPWEYPKSYWGHWTCFGKYAHKWYDRLDSLAKVLQIERQN